MSKINKRLVMIVALLAGLTTGANAEIKLPALIGDNMVVQAGQEFRLWGWADPGEEINVKIGEQTPLTTTAGAQGDWSVMAPAPEAGPVPDIIFAGGNEIAVKNVLAGEVWVCSGQSNMERQLGPRPGQKLIVNWEQEVADASYPEIRHFEVSRAIAAAPQRDVEGEWVVCSPETVADFTAVGYFFGRDLHKAIGRPVGLIHSSWGGTVAEAWSSGPALKTMPAFKDAVEALGRDGESEEVRLKEFKAAIEAWYVKNDPGSKDGASWGEDALDDADWMTMTLPGHFEDAALPGFDGTVWFRKTLVLPGAAAGMNATISLGQIDDQDTVWVNGVRIGGMFVWSDMRKYDIPAGVLKAGDNTIAIRVLDTRSAGGFSSGPDQMSLKIKGMDPISLANQWRYVRGVALGEASSVPRLRANDHNTPTMLYNAMLAPLQPYTIKGVIWYQGESNNNRTMQYRELFPLMIKDWRDNWGLGDFPFLYVQIAPYKNMSPEIRESQFLTLAKSPNTAMAVTTDCGDANDIHPTHKQPVGARLALAARALSYGENIEYSGPLYESMKIKRHRALVSFTHLGGGLMAKGGELKGFEISGDGEQFVEAQASIEGDCVAVEAEGVAAPVAVRYGWSNVPDVNLYNAEGLPASPFRTNVN